jgi:hypothetical protein
MPAILTQMRRDPFGPRIFAECGGGNGVRLIGSSRLAERRNVVDVYVQALVSCWHDHS